MFNLQEIIERLQAMPYGGTSTLNGLAVTRWDKHSFTINDQAHAINGAARVIARNANEKSRVAS